VWDRISVQYVAEKVVLRSESLEVKAKLADEEFKLLQYQDKLASAKETLNNLLGRDINTQFRAVNPTELSPLEENLPAAQALALGQHPKVKEAEITVQQADNARRQVKAQYWPDLAASFHYLSPFGVNFVPTNVMGLGIEFNWEPFDWNRRKHEVNEKVIAVEQSKLSLDDTKAQILINLDTQFRSLHEARVAVADEHDETADAAIADQHVGRLAEHRDRQAELAGHHDGVPQVLGARGREQVLGRPTDPVGAVRPDRHVALQARQLPLEDLAGVGLKAVVHRPFPTLVCYDDYDTPGPRAPGRWPVPCHLLGKPYS